MNLNLEITTQFNNPYILEDYKGLYVIKDHETRDSDSFDELYCLKVDRKIPNELRNINSKMELIEFLKKNMDRIVVGKHLKDQTTGRSAFNLELLKCISIILGIFINKNSNKQMFVNAIRDYMKDFI